MGTTTVNGVIKQVPYGLVRNFRDAATERIEVLVLDSNNVLRDWHVGKDRLNAGIPFYNGDTVKVLYARSSVGATNICDIITVNPSTGAESTASTKAFDAPLRRGIVMKITAINAGTGVATITTTYEVVV